MRAFACRFSPLAEADLIEISLFIATDSPRGAISFVGELRQHCSRIAENPLGYQLREEYGEGVRTTVHGRYLIFHAVRDDQLVIERILHGARHPDWVDRAP